MITIIDTGGNLGSLGSALEKIGAEYEIACQVSAKTTHVILPGVGRADVCMAKLKNYGLADIIPNLKHPVLGICVGFHVLCKSSEEGPTDCLGILPLKVRKLEFTRFGWEQSQTLPGQPYMYFCHQYAPLSDWDVIHWWREKNFTGIQFHAEKSAAAGLEFLKNWYHGQLSKARGS